LGCNPHVIEAGRNHVSGHKAGGGGRHLQQGGYANGEGREALTAWAERLRVHRRKARKSKVVPLRLRRGGGMTDDKVIRVPESSGQGAARRYQSGPPDETGIAIHDHLQPEARNGEKITARHRRKRGFLSCDRAADRGAGNSHGRNPIATGEKAPPFTMDYKRGLPTTTPLPNEA